MFLLYSALPPVGVEQMWRRPLPREVLEHMRACEQAGETVCQSQAFLMAQRSLTCVPTLALSDVTSVMNLVRDSQFTSENRKALIQEARRKMRQQLETRAPGLPRARGIRARLAVPMCHIFNFPLFLLRSDWEALSDPFAEWPDQLAVLLRRCGELGLVNCCEVTAMRMVTTALLAQTPPGRPTGVFQILFEDIA